MRSLLLNFSTGLGGVQKRSEKVSAKAKLPMDSSRASLVSSECADADSIVAIRGRSTGKFGSNLSGLFVELREATD